MKNKKYHTVETVLKCNRTIVESNKPNSHIHNAHSPGLVHEL